MNDARLEILMPSSIIVRGHSFQTTVLDACAQIRSRLTEIRTLGNAKQYGLFLTDEDPKKGVWLEPTKTLEHYLLRNNVRECTLDQSSFCHSVSHHQNKISVCKLYGNDARLATVGNHIDGFLTYIVIFELVLP